jgi:hypothetical protein
VHVWLLMLFMTYKEKKSDCISRRDTHGMGRGLITA